MLNNIKAMVEEYRQLSTVNCQLLKRIERLIPIYEEALANVKALENQDAQDFLARRLYDMTAELVMSLLIIRDAAKAPELFAKSAQVYVRMTEEDVYGKSAYIKAFQVEDLENFKAAEPSANETANEIRDSFKKFFESKQHAIVPSAPMVIKDDPTLMFTNAGMNQWKDIILGTRDPEPRRRADTQKCLRVSGKHNDLEEVGHDTYHHTMFEMLGNWSFGDYFKEGAIDMAWEYLVDVLKLNPADLYVTVFEGSPEENIPRDDEAAKYWAKHVPEDHIINGNKHDNFWEMGDTGDSCRQPYS